MNQQMKRSPIMMALSITMYLGLALSAHAQVTCDDPVCFREFCRFADELNAKIAIGFL